MSSYAAGASASINKTIGELASLLLGTLPRSGPLRTKLREKLRRLVASKAERWYRIGFERGHLESRKIWKQTGAVPKKLAVAKVAKLPGRTAMKRVRLASKAK